MGAPSVHQVALACGTAGAYVDVSAYVLADRTITQKWGRESSFDDVRPRAMTLTFDNGDGRFTPDNPNSPLATTLVEGMGISWLVGTRLVHGTIRTLVPSFDSMLATSARMQVTADDLLGSASRAQPVDPVDAAEVASGRYLGWRMDDPAGSARAVESGGGTPLYPQTFFLDTTAAFGVSAIPGINSTQFQGSDIVLRNNVTLTPTIPYAAGSMGVWGCWYTNVSGANAFAVEVKVSGLSDTFGMSVNGNSPGVYTGSSNSIVTFSFLTGVPHYVAMVVTNSSPTAISIAMYIDGIFQTSVAYGGSGSVPNNAAKTPTSVWVSVGDPSVVGTVSRLLHSASLVREEGAIGTTESSRLRFLANAVPGLSLDTLPKLSSAPLGAVRLSGSVLDMLNEVIKTEQGHIYTTTTGTLTAPVEKVTVRGRDRPTSVSATFSVLNDIIDAPAFIRTLDNTLSQVTVNGPDHTATVTAPALAQRAGSGQDSVLLETVTDLTAWGQDRLIRGNTTGVSIVSFTVDAFTTTSDRWAALAALKPGDRLTVSDLPATQLGFATWDCWIIGGQETHTEETHLFTFYVMPVQAPVAKYGTARYMSGGELSLSSSVTSIATSWSVATTKTKLSTTAVPYTLLVDTEQVTVTACTSATPQVLTVTRHVNGTIAASHSSGASVEVAPPSSIYGF